MTAKSLEGTDVHPSLSARFFLNPGSGGSVRAPPRSGRGPRTGRHPGQDGSSSQGQHRGNTVQTPHRHQSHNLINVKRCAAMPPLIYISMAIFQSFDLFSCRLECAAVLTSGNRQSRVALATIAAVPRQPQRRTTGREHPKRKRGHGFSRSLLIKEPQCGTKLRSRYLADSDAPPRPTAHPANGR